MRTTHRRRPPLALAGLCAALTALTLAAGGRRDCRRWSRRQQLRARLPPRSCGSRAAPFAARPFPRGYEFLGLPYAAPPTGEPALASPAASGRGGTASATRRSSRRAARSRRARSRRPRPSQRTASTSTSTRRRCGATVDRPVLVWIHGGGFTEDGARNYDGSKLAADGIVVVTINYRLGALGFLAHPALAARPGGPAGNYGLMDQHGGAALGQAQHRTVRRRPAQRHDRWAVGRWRVGARPAGLASLARAVPAGDRAERRVRADPAAARCRPRPPARRSPPQRAVPTRPPNACATLPVDALLNNFPGAAIPGVIDGKVLTESIGTALAAGRFARVPILNGINHHEELIFVAGLHVAVSGGTFVPIPENRSPPRATSPTSPPSWVCRPSAPRAIAAEYPLGAYPAPTWP